MFLSKRVTLLTEEDYEKLKRLIRYIIGSIDELLDLRASDLSVVLNFIDATYGVHKDMRSHTGSASTLGYGVFSSVSSKQKLNTTSLMTSELIGIADYLPKELYFRNFLEVQGIKIKRNIILQDNKSTMLMEKNHRRSCSKRT